MKRPFNHVKILILFCLPFNTALAGEIYSTDFESGSLTPENGFTWNSGVKTTVSNQNSKSGAYSLKFTFPASAAGKDSFSEQRFNLGGFYPDLWIKYDLYIPSNYTHRSDEPGNNKGLVFLWAGIYEQVETREGPILGTQFWGGPNSELTLYGGARVNGSVTLDYNWGFYIGENTRLTTTHTQAELEAQGSSSEFISANDRGHWMTVVVHAKYATIANNDGVYEVWKTDWQGNTTKAINIQDGPWYGTQAGSTLPARGFDQGYLLGWANSGFNEDTILYIDNLKVSTTTLLSADDLAAPKPPLMMTGN